MKDSVSYSSLSKLPSRQITEIAKDSIYCIVNKEFTLPENYIPEDLTIPDIKFNITYNTEKKNLRAEAANAIEKLFDAAIHNKLILGGVSGYRSYARQKEIYTHNLATKGIYHTNKYSASPGSSEHQTGLAMDVSCSFIGYSLTESFAHTPEGKWLAENCHKYGFIIRYPKNKEHITGYSYEPWHIRYVGIFLSTYLHINQLVLEEYYNIKTRYEN